MIYDGTWYPRRAVAFDGATSRGILPAASFPGGELPLVGSMTGSVSLWVRRTTAGTGSNNNLWFSGNGNWSLQFRLASGNIVATVMRNDGVGGVTQSTRDCGAINQNVWVHMLSSYSSVHGWRVWRDGVEVGSATLAASGLSLGRAPATTELRLCLFGSTFHPGAVAQLSLWSSYETDPAKMRTAGGVPRDILREAGLLHWWQLGDRYRLGSFAMRDRLGTGADWSLINMVESTDIIAGPA